MVDARQQLFDSYEQLLIIKRQQLSVASKEQYDEQIDELKELELQTLSLKAAINDIRLDEQLYNIIVVNYHNDISLYIQELQTINNQLQHKISKWYSDVSGEMKQVTTHRKTLQTYGGVNYSDVISYYIDDKK